MEGLTSLRKNREEPDKREFYFREKEDNLFPQERKDSKEKDVAKESVSRSCMKSVMVLHAVVWT